MAALKTISAALKLVDAKKENLRKSFEDLQAHSSSLSSFTLTWSDLDSYFTSIQTSLDRKFKILQSQLEQSQSQSQPQSQPPPPNQPQSQSQSKSKSKPPSPNQPQSQSQSQSQSKPPSPNQPQSQTKSKPPSPNQPQSQSQPKPKPQSSSSSVVVPSPNQPQSQSKPPSPNQPQSQPKPQPSSSLVVVKNQPESARVLARMELKSFCEKMDGLGLRKYMIDRPKERNTIRAELPDALRCAPDAAAMVLDAMEGFFSHNAKGNKDIELNAVRRSCLILLEELMRLKVEIGAEVKEKAKKLAAQWIGKLNVQGDYPLEAMGFLNLLAAFNLADDFNANDLIEFASIVAKFGQAVQLCRVLGLGDRIPDLVQKLIGKGKPLLAVKFIFEFELLDKFPPVPILKEHVMESKRLTQQILQEGKISVVSRNEAITKEVTVLKAVIKIIDDRKLQSEYPKQELMERLETLEKEKSDRKELAAGLVSETQQQSKPKKLSGSKRPRTTAPDGPAATATSSAVPAFQRSPLQPEGLVPENPIPYLSSSTGPYGLVAASTPAVAAYTDSSTGLYGSSGAPLGMPGNLMPTQPHAYPSESHVLPSGYYDRPVAAYGGYVLPPQYHPPYHPQ